MHGPRASALRVSAAPPSLCGIALCWLATLAGAAVPAALAPEPAGFWTGPTDAPVPATLRGGRVVHATALAAELAHGGVVVIDVSDAPRRPDTLAPGAPWMPLAHRGVPGALWIPGAGAGAIGADLDEFYRARLDAATQGNLDAPLVVYCHAKCWLSWNGAKRAIGYGYRRVQWFPDGIEGWTAAGQPTASAPPLGPPAAAARAPISLLVLDLELTGDLGGPEFTAEHEARLTLESARLRQDLERSGLFRIVDDAPAAGTLDRLRSQQAYLHDCNGCDLEVGRQLGADQVMVAWVDRVSGLILSLTYEIHDVKTSQIVARKSFDFRGDNDVAWNHAIDYMVRDLKAESSAGT
jgi:PQQ-dependent catabolism-associated CXXCW motif protein